MARPTRYNTIPGVDNSAAILSRENQTLTYGATVTVYPTAEKTKAKLALTGAANLVIDCTKSYEGDELEISFSADSSQRTVTLSTGVGSETASTVVVAASKKAIIAFSFNGTTWDERFRAVGV